MNVNVSRAYRKMVLCHSREGGNPLIELAKSFIWRTNFVSKQSRAMDSRLRGNDTVSYNYQKDPIECLPHHLPNLSPPSLTIPN